MAPPGAPRGGAEVELRKETSDVGVRQVPRERVRVRREVVTEEVTVVVVVRREVLRVEREPLDAQGPAQGRGAGPSGGPPVEVVLSEERPVVHLEVVPYERVRVGVRSVSTTTPVLTSTHREVADVVTGPDDAPGGRTDELRSTP